MGIRFSCHGCSKPLNIKNELAGRRGVCPDCNTKFRIPMGDAEFSIPLENSIPEHPSVSSGSGQKQLQPVPQPVLATGLEAELLSEDSTSTWYVRPPSGGQYGPATTEILKNWINEGRVAKSALIWRDGWPQWREASEALPELADSLPGSYATEANPGFADPTSTSKLTTPVAREKTSPVRADLSGDSKIGATRRKRNSQRIALVAVLAALVVGLVITLLIVATTRG